MQSGIVEKNDYTVSIAAPAYNEADCISEVINAWVIYLKKTSFVSDYEIIICNDGSTDNTGFILDKFSKNNSKIVPLHFSKNIGAAAALRAAIKKTRMELVFLIDSDGQFPISNFEVMLQQLKLKKCKAVIGIRQKKATFKERFGTRLSGLIANLIYKSNLTDFNSACKLIDGPSIRHLSLEAIGMNYSTEVTARLLESQIPITEVAIAHEVRLAGHSKMKFLKGALDRFLLITYLWFRSILIKRKIIMRSETDRYPGHFE